MNPFAGPQRWLTIAFVVPIIVLFLWMVRGLLGALAFAGLFAILLAPLQRRLELRLGKRKGFAPALVLLGAVLIIFSPLAFVAVMAVRSFAELARAAATIPRERVAEWSLRIYGLVESVARRLRINVSHEDITQGLTDAGQMVLGALGNFFGMLAKSTPGTLLLAFIFLTAFYFMLRDGQALTEWMAHMLPFAKEDTRDLFGSVRDAVRGVMLGSLLVGIVQSSIVLALLLLLDVPGAFVLGVLAFFLSFVPIVGTTPISGGAVIYLLVTGQPGAAVAMAVGIVVVGLSDNIVRPLVHARSGNIHPLLSLVSIFGGLQAFGAGGVFLGPVIAAFALWAVELYGRSRPATAALPAERS